MDEDGPSFAHLVLNHRTSLAKTYLPSFRQSGKNRLGARQLRVQRAADETLAEASELVQRLPGTTSSLENVAYVH